MLLRGVNTDALTERPQLSRVSLRLLRAVGWNAVRIQLSWPRLEPQPGRVDERRLAEVARLVAALEEAGVYSVVAVQPVGLVPGSEPVDGARSPSDYTAVLRKLARRLARERGVAAFDVVDATGDLAAAALKQLRAGERRGRARAPHLVFVGPRAASAVAADRSVVLAPRGTTVAALGEMRSEARALGGAPVVVSEWTPGGDAAQHQDAQNGLRFGAFAATRGLVDPRGVLSRAYVRAAPGRLEFSHYEEPRGHFAARGVAPRANRARIEIFYPGSKHPDARFRARGIDGLRASRLPGGGRLVTGVPRGRWSFQIGPTLQ